MMIRVKLLRDAAWLNAHRLTGCQQLLDDGTIDRSCAENEQRFAQHWHLEEHVGDTRMPVQRFMSGCLVGTMHQGRNGEGTMRVPHDHCLLP